ncbi:response regulator transcription factor [Streptococcus sp. NLN64]|uniref:helix-turn-helix transcriptional regulator n=1 Tax=Streptococcus sp. NLN64 TaxID=2822799 RepID=UPI0018CB34D7|nr:response regulator transcription factor [Streptococcus sp. NLN64]MBG9367064.1 response regulator transcription factor [Streptococcus sp. NLN64]
MTILFIGRREFLAQALSHIYKDLTFDLYLKDWTDSYLDIIAQRHPRMVILEITRPERRAFSACQVIRQHFPEQAVLLFSTHYREYYFLKSQECAANGYLHQDLSMKEITNGISDILSGLPSFPYSTVNLQTNLTPREIDILYQLRQNHTQTEIAALLNISRRTVNNHLTHIQDKLETNSSLGSVLRAIELGIL